MSGSHIELRNDGVYVDGTKIPGVVLTPVKVELGDGSDVNMLTVSIPFQTITDERTDGRRGWMQRGLVDFDGTPA